MTFDPKQIITDQILEQIKNGTPKWRKPWVGGLNKNPITGAVYKPLNQLLLQSAGFSDWRWYGPGWCVENSIDFKGAKKVYIPTYFMPGERNAVSDSDGQSTPLVTPSSKQYTKKPFARMTLTGLFNAEQLRGIPKNEELEDLPEFSPIELIDALIDGLREATNLIIEHGGQVACYAPSADTITLPRKELFLSPMDYYATLLHEAGHAACNARRLNIHKESRFGALEYAYEEFVVELASCQVLGQFHGALSQTCIGQHAAYMESWAKLFKSDKEVVFRASKDALLVANYLSKFAPGFQLDADVEPHEIGIIAADPAIAVIEAPAATFTPTFTPSILKPKCKM
jgi:antirestriction protein ArdC